MSKQQEERDLRFNEIPITWLLIREINPMAGILFLRNSQISNKQQEEMGNEQKKDVWGLSRGTNEKVQDAIQSLTGYDF